MNQPATIRKATEGHTMAVVGDVYRFLAILFQIEAWDVNCPHHIHKRFSQKQVAPVKAVLASDEEMPQMGVLRVIILRIKFAFAIALADLRLQR